MRFLVIAAVVVALLVFLEQVVGLVVWLFEQIGLPLIGANPN